MFSTNLWLIRKISTNLWVKSSSERSPVSKVMEGLTVTGGTGKTVKTNHSGLATSGLIPKTKISSAVILSNLSLISEAVNL